MKPSEMRSEIVRLVARTEEQQREIRALREELKQVNEAWRRTAIERGKLIEIVATLAERIGS